MHIHYCHKYIVIVCILTVQISTTVLHKLLLYWAVKIKVLGVAIYCTCENAFCSKLYLGPHYKKALKCMILLIHFVFSYF